MNYLSLKQLEYNPKKRPISLVDDRGHIFKTALLNLKNFFHEDQGQTVREKNQKVLSASSYCNLRESKLSEPCFPHLSPELWFPTWNEFVKILGKM